MLNEENISENNDINHRNIKPWNSKEFPVKINNIRYNQNYSLFILATSKGYKIFSTNSLEQVHEETNKVRELGDISLAMTYYSSNLVFFVGKKSNGYISQKELIVFDDFSQDKISSFKSKKENIINFYVGKYEIYIVLESEIIVIELITFKIVNIIKNIYSEPKLCSFNINGFSSFIKKNEKNKAYIKVLNFENNKIISIKNTYIIPNFESIQSIQLSHSGKYIALSSIFGNKIHIYYVDNLILKECFYLGNEINNLIKMSFPLKEENFLILQINENKFRIFVFSNILEGQYKCICNKYKNEELVKEVIKRKENENGWVNYIKNKYFNYSTEDNDANNALIAFVVKEGILFLDFDDEINKNQIDNKKKIIIINKKGYYYKFSFNKEGIKQEDNYNMNLNLEESFQWI